MAKTLIDIVIRVFIAIYRARALQLDAVTGRSDSLVRRSRKLLELEEGPTVLRAKGKSAPNITLRF